MPNQKKVLGDENVEAYKQAFEMVFNPDDKQLPGMTFMPRGRVLPMAYDLAMQEFSDPDSFVEYEVYENTEENRDLCRVGERVRAEFEKRVAQRDENGKLVCETVNGIKRIKYEVKKYEDYVVKRYITLEEKVLIHFMKLMRSVPSGAKGENLVQYGVIAFQEMLSGGEDNSGGPSYRM